MLWIVHAHGNDAARAGFYLSQYVRALRARGVSDGVCFAINANTEQVRHGMSRVGARKLDATLVALRPTDGDHMLDVVEMRDNTVTLHRLQSDQLQEGERIGAIIDLFNTTLKTEARA